MKPSWVLIAVVVIASFATHVHSLAVMSIDFGSEWMKIGIVSPGVPMEIALNKESKRKTAAVIAFRDNVRTFGEDAQTVGIRFPHLCYGYLIDLLGKSIDNPVVQRYMKRFPYYEIVEDSSRGTIRFKYDADTYYTPEELIAQILFYAKGIAESSANQAINDVVITVPGYFNQIERHALIQAANLANLKVLQLINDYTAVALNYGIFRSKDFNETATYVLFYDMGASKTTATVVNYQLVKTKDRGVVETNPQLSVVGVGYDRQLGGLEMQTRLRDYLAEKFNEMKLTKNDVTKNPRSMAKLFKEAGRLKNVLSANNDHFAQIENLIDEKDFRVQITREDFERICEDLFARVAQPIDAALKMSGLTIDLINQVILVGGGTRVPKVQDELQKYTKLELSKNINADEAATMGAVYKAADLSTGFKVKKFVIKDGVLLPVQVTFERDLDKAEDGVQTKTVKRTLFGLMNPYPQKKIITFNRYASNFKFNVNFGDLDHLPQQEIDALGSHNLTQFELKNLTEVIEKFSNDVVDPKGVKAHFLMDDSGLLRLIHVDYVVEKNVTDDDEQSAFAKLGNTLSNLFKSADEKVEPENNKTESDEKKETESKEEEKPAKKESDDDEKKAVKSKIVQIKEPIAAASTLLTTKPMTEDEFETSRVKLADLNIADFERHKRETALNNLESFVIDLQNRLDSDEYTTAAKPEDIEKIKAKSSEISEWLYEDGSDADGDKYEEKLREIQTMTRDLYSRVYEHKERPEAIKALNELLKNSQTFLTSARNYSKGIAQPDSEIFTEVEVMKLETVINDTNDWRDQMSAEQGKLKRSDTVKLTIRSISEKINVLDREVKYLINKMKIWRPKAKKVDEKAEQVEKPVVEENVEKKEESVDAEDSADAEVSADEVRKDEATTGTDPTDDHSEL